MEEKVYSLEEASKELDGRYSPDNLRVKILRGEIQGEKVSKGKRQVWGLSLAVINLLKENKNTDIYAEMRDEWEKAQRHGTHGKEPKPVSEKTIAGYKGYVKRYFDCLGLPPSIENLSPDNFEKCMWTFEPNPEKRKDHYPTRQKIYNAVTSFYLHLIKRGLKNEGELAVIRRLRPKQTYPEKRRVLTDEQWKTLFKANDFMKGRTEFDKELSQTLLLLYTTAGLRRAEAIQLETDWINLETGQMEILGKNNKWRTVFANDILLAQIRKWLKKYRPKSKHPNLLLKDDGEPVTPRMVRARITTLRERAGLDIDIHGLRRTFATLCLQEGVAVNDVQELLGHEHLTTTEKYVRTNKMRAARTVQKLTFGLSSTETEPLETNETFPNERTRGTAKRIIQDEWD